VGVVAPAGPFDRQTFEQGLAVLQRRYEVVFSERIFEQQRYLAGTDEVRAKDLQAALDDPSLGAIFAARGGYGCLRLLPLIDLGGVTPRALVGFSDLTALHARLQAHGFRSLHGPNVTQLATQPAEVVNRLFDALEGRPLAPLTGTATFVPGVAEGPLVGGNLTVFASLVGTRFLPSLEGAVLLLEDVGERPYRLDRRWTQLKEAGLFQGVQGIALGDFTGCEEKDATYSSADVLLDLAQSLGLPCVAGFRVGHGEVNLPVPLGARVRLDAATKTLSFLDALVG
jgi:muramoyltetrapeptide carboxypeptidase